MDVDSCNENIENSRRVVQFYMMETEDIVPNINLVLKNESWLIVSINSQSITFRLSIEEIEFFKRWRLK